jgi:hypothetical protein
MTANHLEKNTPAHQGSYLMPLLKYFSNADLSTTKANEDYIYFTIPFTFISYPLVDYTHDGSGNSTVYLPLIFREKPNVFYHSAKS